LPRRISPRKIVRGRIAFVHVEDVYQQTHDKFFIRQYQQRPKTELVHLKCFFNGKEKKTIKTRTQKYNCLKGILISNINSFFFMQKVVTYYTFLFNERQIKENKIKNNNYSNKHCVTWWHRM
jgi:hypothetical protein